MNAYKKGYRGESELADVLSTMFRVDVKRGASPYLPGFIAKDVYGIPGVHIEVKRRERVSLPDALRQARHDSGGLLPIVCHRGNGRPWAVTLLLEDLPELATTISMLLSSGVQCQN
jgi:hypothetical protein